MSDQIARNYFTILPITVKHAAVLTTGPDNPLLPASGQIE